MHSIVGMMKFKILSVLIISVLVVGVFGFMALGTINHNGQHSCPVSSFSGGGCPPAEGNIMLALHHLSGIQKLVQAINIADASLLVFLFLLTIILLIFFKPLDKNIPSQVLSRKIFYKISEFNFVAVKQFIRWYSTLYKLDPLRY